MIIDGIRFFAMIAILSHFGPFSAVIINGIRFLLDDRSSGEQAGRFIAFLLFFVFVF